MGIDLLVVHETYRKAKCGARYPDQEVSRIAGGTTRNRSLEMYAIVVTRMLQLMYVRRNEGLGHMRPQFFDLNVNIDLSPSLFVS